ncbi:MAG: YdcF family protein [Puniceicoccaceae bacterium]
MDLFLNSLYSPFFYFFFGSLFAWVYVMMCYFSRARGFSRRLILLYGFGLVLIWGFASPLGNRLLLVSLLTDHPTINLEDPNAPSPDFILVAASGYLIMGDSQEDVLYDRTAQRVATAAKLHSQFPEAVLIMQGTGYKAAAGGGQVRPAEHQGELMRRLAISMGVPEDKVRIEDQSRNSREHVEALQELDGISPDSRLVVVSSDWHIRRLQMVFTPVFANTSYQASETPVLHGFALSLLWPDESTLSSSRMYLREWAGMIYYSLTD